MSRGGQTFAVGPLSPEAIAEDGLSVADDVRPVAGADDALAFAMEPPNQVTWSFCSLATPRSEIEW